MSSRVARDRPSTVMRAASSSADSLVRAAIRATLGGRSADAGPVSGWSADARAVRVDDERGSAVRCDGSRWPGAALPAWTTRGRDRTPRRSNIHSILATAAQGVKWPGRPAWTAGDDRPEGCAHPHRRRACPASVPGSTAPDPPGPPGDVVAGLRDGHGLDPDGAPFPPGPAGVLPASRPAASQSLTRWRTVSPSRCSIRGTTAIRAGMGGGGRGSARPPRRRS